MKIVFATNNANKLKEVREALPQHEIVGLKDIECFEELPETSDTLEGNAQQKAEYVFNKFNIPCFADDTGLLVDALNGAPGVYSARYSGPACDSEENMKKLLSELGTTPNRKAHFKTVICYYNGSPSFFTGEAHGNITTEKIGEDGFGYDPVFQPDGYNVTFAEMSMAKKNEISHRGKAVRKFIEGLKAIIE